jgi:hypothetical protein
MTFDEWWEFKGSAIFRRHEGYRVAREAWHASLASRPEERKIPDVLFDGHAVFLEVERQAGPEHTIKAHHVSAVLDAVVRLMRGSMNNGG